MVGENNSIFIKPSKSNTLNIVEFLMPQIFKNKNFFEAFACFINNLIVILWIRIVQRNGILKRIFLHILLGFNFVFILVLILSYLSVYIPPDKYWIPSLFGLIYPYALFLNFLFVVTWILIKPKYLIFSLLIILIGGNFFNRYFKIWGRTSDNASIKVLSYNVRNFQGEGRIPSKYIAENIKLFLEEQQPDLICLQEVKLRSNRVFNLPQVVAKFPFINHYQYATTGSTTGLATLTKFPVVNMGEIRFDNSKNMAIFTDILMKEDTVRVFNIHLQSYYIDPDKYDIIDSPGISEARDFRQVKEMGNKYRNAVKMRAEQARNIHEKIIKSPYKVIVCGDFNDTPVSYSYQKVLGKLKDAFVKSGKGIGRTYIGRLPSFRIDYILYSKGFKAYNFKKASICYSDHLPVYCNLELDH